MAQFELNIYGNNDEIVKQFTTDKVRWGVFMQALELQTELEESGSANQFELINKFVKKIFPDLTDKDLENADIDDVLNTFKQLLSKANKIGNTKKNLEGAQ